MFEDFNQLIMPIQEKLEYDSEFEEEENTD